MEPIPLIPKSTIKSNHDISHAIHESFQEILGKTDYPSNIMKNMSKYTLENQELTQGAFNSKYAIEKYNEKTTLIDETERELMENHGIYLIGKEILTQNQSLNESLQLKRLSLLPDVRYTNEFGLIKQQNLLPNPIEKSIDFRLNSNRHHCITKCLSPTEINVSEKRLEPIKNKITGRKEVFETIFEAMPNTIVFYNYKLNVKYKKTLKLRNTTQKIRSIALKTLPKSNEFKIILESTSKIAPGMSAIYTIEYKTSIFKDLKETIKFNTYTGKDVSVKLQSCSNSPNLRVYVFKTNYHPQERYSNVNVTQSDFNIERTMALNSSIDCGCVLVGSEVKISLIVKNEGGFGKFFFLNEADWYHYSILNVNESMELVSDAFKLYPAYFEVNQGKFIEILISFYPKRNGLFVETVYLLCSNNTCEELDLIGDGVYFEKNFITFELKPKESEPFFLDKECDYCIHLGKTLSCQPITGEVKIHNNSPLNLNYRWSVRQSSSPNFSDFKHLASHWISIEDRFSSSKNDFPYYSVKDFIITVNPETIVGGLYRIVLCLYIENIPEISLKDHQDFTVIENNKSKEDFKIVDVLVGQIEILLDVEPIGIIIEPNPLIIPFNPTNKNHLETISIISQTCYTVQCQWKHHKTNRFTSIEPRVFQLTDKIECSVRINLDGNFQSFEEQFLLLANDGVYKQQFTIVLNTKTPKAVFDQSLLVFGDLMSQFLYEKSLFVENLSEETIFWEVFEETYQSDGDLVEGRKDAVFPPTGVLKPFEKTKIRYMANTQVLGEVQSYLKLITNFTEPQKFDSICSVNYNVCKPELLVHTNTSEWPILCPEDLLCVGKPIQMHICVHNLGNIVAIYLWGDPKGSSKRDFDIIISPKVGLIKKGQNVHIDVTIKPKSMGFYEDIYLPLFVLGADEVILVKLMCLVGDITVNIYLPGVNDEYSCVLWPKIFIDDYEEVYVPEFDQNYQLIDDEGKNEIKCQENEEIFEDRPKYFEEGFNPGEFYEESFDYFKQDEFIQSSEKLSSYTSESESLNSTFTSVCTKSIREKMLELFKGEITLQKYCIEFHGVPLRTPIKKTIKIENLTPGEGKIYIEAANFYHENERKKNVDDILAELKLLKSSKWDEMVTSDGIVVKIEEPSKMLKPFEIIEFNVWVYATTWGYYLDELMIDISEILPFCVSVLIEVVGQPIEYPIGLNSIRNEPILRLGFLPYKSQTVQRRVKIVNTSVCTLYISWNIFINAPHVQNTQKSLSIVLDLPIDEENDSKCDSKPKFFILNDYFGEPNLNYFEIKPLTLKIPPKNYGYINITTNVNNFDEMYLDQKIFAYLIGIIKIPCNQRFHSNLFVRPHGTDLKPTKFKITLQIEIPTLTISDLDLNNSLQLSTYASDVLEKKYFQITRRLLFKNTTKTQALVFMEVDDPFRIKKVVIPHLEMRGFKANVALNPESTMEVFLECFLSQKDVEELVDNLKIGSKNSSFSNIDFDQKSLRICKELKVYQRGVLEKCIPLELKVFFPVFTANPVHIQFGNVYIGNTSKQIVCLRNLTVTPLNFNIYKVGKYPEIIITPRQGTIKALTSGEEFVISIFFTPTEPQTYLLWFAIETPLPFHFIVVNVVGVGTYDEKYYKPGLH